MIDLDAYLARIGYEGSREPTAATLSSIHEHHARSIPFENLDVVLGRGIRIDPISIERKLVNERRGGYCFEQNNLLAAALRALGFQVLPLMARVRWQIPEGTITALTHLLLRVEASGEPYLADVGFGSMSLYRPLKFRFDLEQEVSLEPRRLVRRTLAAPAGEILVEWVSHQAKVGGEWSDVYQFTLEPASDVDFEMGNWFTSAHPQSRFVQNLIASRTEDWKRYTLLNREFTIRHRDGRVEKRELSTPDELLEVLKTHFKLQFPAGSRFDSPGITWPE
jgi:N-hydroxyarylamine O-acetyltransferase